MNKLTISLAQIYPKFGDLETNLQTHLDLLEQAAEENAQLVVFPELSLTGYYLQDLVEEVATPKDSIPIQALCEQSRKLELDTMVGFVDVSERGKHYIASAYISRGDILHIHHKVYLPTYGMFDDGRYFTLGDHIRAFNTSYGRVGMLICEDFWHLSAPYLLWLDGADILLMHSASPGRGLDTHSTLETPRWVETMLSVYGTQFSNFVVHCSRVGFEDGRAFSGGSAIVNPNGDFLVKAPYFDETLTTSTIDLNQIRRTRSRVTMLRDERTALTARELQRIVTERSDGLL